MKIDNYILVVVTLILNSCSSLTTQDLVGEWSGKQCPLSFELKPDGTVVYTGVYSGYGGKYKVEDNNVVLYSNSDKQGLRFEKKGDVLVLSAKTKCEKQSKKIE